MFDFTPATSEAARLLEGVREDHFTALTPCDKWRVAELLDHLAGLCLAFTAAAGKTSPSTGASSPGDWREQLQHRLATLAEAWTHPTAWEGTTEAGGVTMPGRTCAVVALDEVVVHSWDLAVATGQEVVVHPPVAATLHGFWSARDDTGAELPRRAEIFGHPVAVPVTAPVFDQVLGLTGRDPLWRAASLSRG
ncbi:TIGR03086 family protein [Kineosporia sp. J2-2]|uniref:TIGR03086 family protein n=1 Tax=Kineosporia corallincola TaxID=2835133 RepID=A0ABS5TEZ9_9ACTN|nr:TIGR03086 family metal-binding protein [Kineosporia corallincola]MBT0769662.1 TIGR03086 family protein [Kineosporia corallincola]